MRDDLHRHTSVSKWWKSLIYACVREPRLVMTRLQQAITTDIQPLAHSPAFRGMDQTTGDLFNHSATGLVDHLGREGAAPIEGSVREVLQWGDVQGQLSTVVETGTELHIDRIFHQISSEIGRDKEVAHCRAELMNQLKDARARLPQHWLRDTVRSVVEGAVIDRPSPMKATIQSKVPLGIQGRLHQHSARSRRKSLNE